jgi:hypothetical protein
MIAFDSSERSSLRRGYIVPVHRHLRSTLSTDLPSVLCPRHCKTMRNARTSGAEHRADRHHYRQEFSVQTEIIGKYARRQTGSTVLKENPEI